jgi:hypothetical protein
MADRSGKDLAQRVGEIEDYIDILQLIAAYGPAADATAWDVMTRLWAEDGVYDIPDMGRFEGHDGLKRLFGGTFHQGLMESGSGHLTLLPHVVLDGDRASATHHGMVVKQVDGGFPVVRLTATRWELERRSHAWVIVRRTNELMRENPRARELLGRVLEKPSNSAS